MGDIANHGAARRTLLVLAAAALVTSTAATSTAQTAPEFPEHPNTVMFAAANFIADTCRYQLAVGAFEDDRTPSGPSTLYAVDPTTGAATMIGPIQDPDLPGRTVLLTFNEGTGRDEYYTLSDTESIVDVCGLAVVDGRLLGTATLDELKAQIAIEIDPATGEATFLSVIQLDVGVQPNRDWLEPPDPTLCTVHDLDYVPSLSQLITVIGCQFHWCPTLQHIYRDGNRGNVSLADVCTSPSDLWDRSQVSRTQISRVGVPSLLGVVRAIPRDPGTVSTQAPSINLQAFPPYTIAHHPTLQENAGTIGFAWVPYTSGDVLGVPVIGYTGHRMDSFGTLATTSLAFDSANDDLLYRSVLELDLGGGGPNTGASYFETIDWETGQEIDPVTRELLPAENLIPILDGATPLVGVQAIAFGHFPDDSDLGTNDMDFSEVAPCPPHPKKSGECSGSVSDKGLRIKYRANGGKLKIKGQVGNGVQSDFFGDPEDFTSYSVCIYTEIEEDDTQLSLAGGRQLAAGSDWKSSKSGVQYSAKSPKTKLKLKLGGKRGQNIDVNLSGDDLSLPDPPFSDFGLRIQIVGSNGACIDAGFDDGTFLKNDAKQFKAKR